MRTATPTPAAPKRGAYQQGATNLAIIHFVEKAGVCEFEQLAEIFEEHGTAESRENFRCRLNYLTDTARLRATGRGRTRIWQLGALPYGPGQPHPRTLAPAPAAPAAPKYVGPIVPPRQVDVMFGPVYRPGAGPALRPGALDFKSIARRGHAC